MCGIVGLVGYSERRTAAAEIVRNMSSALIHRGPDDEGFFSDEHVSFGFRRLSIIDVKSGRQPISSEDGSIRVMLNGEIYNYIELRQHLEKSGHVFSTHSDTEVIVHAYESMGIDFVNALRGMFAIALWDSRQHLLILARDRMGQKPLFYSSIRGQLAFASEIKALIQWPELRKVVDPRALHDYFSYLYIPGARSILRGVEKLKPGHLLCLRQPGSEISITQYWKPTYSPDYSRSLGNYAEELVEELDQASRIRLRSDVPVGAFLSGGIDSSIIASLMSRHSSAVHTFCMGFTDKRFDESPFAGELAKEIGTNHTTQVLDPDSFGPEDFLKCIYYMDEPFGDSSFVATYWLSMITRSKVKVALSGDGGDELFGGYSRYRNLRDIQSMQRLPSALRHWIEDLSRRTRSSHFPSSDTFFRQLNKAMRLSRLSENDLIISLSMYFSEAEKKELFSMDWQESLGPYSSFSDWKERLHSTSAVRNAVDRMMFDEIGVALVDDMLVKVDRASMACSLEVRSPFLDHKVVELALQIPLEYKLNRGVSKLVLRRAFENMLPRKVFKRKKQGFEVPLGNWFSRNEWREFVSEVLSPAKLKDEGIFDVQAVIQICDQVFQNPFHASNDLSAYQLWHRIWMILCFQCWYDLFIHSTPTNPPSKEIRSSIR